MTSEKARHAKAIREIQDGTKEKKDEEARKEAAAKGFVEGTTVYLNVRDDGDSSFSTLEFGVAYRILAISDVDGEVWADVENKDQLCDCCDGFVMHPISALTLAAPVCEWRLVDVPPPKRQCSAVRSSMAQGDDDAAKS